MVKCKTGMRVVVDSILGQVKNLF